MELLVFPNTNQQNLRCQSCLGSGLVSHSRAPVIGNIFQDLDNFKKKGKILLIFSQSSQDIPMVYTPSWVPLNTSHLNLNPPFIQ